MALECDTACPCLNCGESCSTGFMPHKWRPLCSTCGCMLEQHNITEPDADNVVAEAQLTDHKQYHDYKEALNIAKQSDLAWLPIGVGTDDVNDFLDSLSEADRPYREGTGDVARKRRMRLQLPLSDRRADLCRFAEGEEDLKLANQLFEERNMSALGFGEVGRCDGNKRSCHQCSEPVISGHLCVRTPLHSDNNDTAWHADCFRCTKCKDLLVDFLYCWDTKENDLLCLRHYMDSVKPRCSVCTELIFSEEYRLMEVDYHAVHLICQGCEIGLPGQRYAMHKDMPYCITCYDDRFANLCDACNLKIKMGDKDLMHNNRHWHTACFTCANCKQSLAELQFAMHGESELYCAECYATLFSERCDSCKEIFKTGEKKYQYKGRQLHDTCFTCTECHEPIGTKNFLQKNEQLICVTCYEANHVPKCAKCSQPIKSGGLTYKEQPWHAECLVCTNCDKQLSGSRFASREDRPYCTDCHTELFAKKCAHCGKAITGFGDGRYVSFEERQWHPDCFQCTKCNGSLVGRSFLFDGDSVVCPECGAG